MGIDSSNNNTNYYNQILLNHQKNEIMPLAAIWMDLEIITLSEVSQKEEVNWHLPSLAGAFLIISATWEACLAHNNPQ